MTVLVWVPDTPGGKNRWLPFPWLAPAWLRRPHNGMLPPRVMPGNSNKVVLEQTRPIHTPLLGHVRLCRETQECSLAVEAGNGVIMAEEPRNLVMLLTSGVPFI